MPKDFKKFPLQFVSLCNAIYEESIEAVIRDGVPTDKARSALNGRVNEWILTKLMIGAAWNKSQAAFDFNGIFSEELCFRSGEIDEIPCSVLGRIPYDCFYVHYGREALFGYFVLKRPICDSDSPNIKFELLFLPLNSDLFAKYAFKLPLIENATIGDAKELASQKDIASMKKAGLCADGESLNYIIKEYKINLSQMLAQILYICSENADIKEASSCPNAWKVGYVARQEIDARKYTQAGEKRRYSKRGHFKTQASHQSNEPLLFWYSPTFSDKTKP